MFLDISGKSSITLTLLHSKVSRMSKFVNQFPPFSSRGIKLNCSLFVTFFLSVALLRSTLFLVPLVPGNFLALEQT